MTFHATTQKSVLFVSLVVTGWVGLANRQSSNFSDGFSYFIIALLFFILLSFLIQYRMNIAEKHLTYQVFVWIIPIYKKVIHPYQIKQMKFKRFGWATKGAIIQVRKGFNIRLFDFSPTHIFEELVNFSDENDIAFIKTKDYQILE
ncbi:hypothetical protein [Psychrobacillus vulpis]|uniref:Uncharacterized protein n=1 Tax=Psychrobacillus vulpis TaxID=2325572 RepID=A0A544TNK7_9BACI|nr:hypothetical protein [Psychrobacillus vulpis]TQR19015.1 hypothetical protein FG384_14425 [Psychrobacillus vulpis]